MIIEAEFIPVIVTARALTDDVYPEIKYQQLPQGADPGALRIVRARDVQYGDWYLGDCEQPTRARSGVFWGVHTIGTYPALPHLRESDNTVAMDGESYVWSADELVMIVPRQLLPTPAYAPGDRVERSIEHIPDGPGERLLGRSRHIIQRGTVETTDPADGSLTVAWDGDWGTFRTSLELLRHVNATTVAHERAAFGFAVGDKVEYAEGNDETVAIALELWHHWFHGTPMTRVCWPPLDSTTPARHQVLETARLRPAAAPGRNG